MWVQRSSEVECRPVYNIITPLLQRSPPEPWFRSLHVTVTLCQDTQDTVLQVLDSRQEVLTCPVLCPCCCVLNHTQLVARTRRHAMALWVASVNLRHPRRTTSWVLRTSVSWLQDCSSVLSSGPGTYRSSPTYRSAMLTFLRSVILDIAGLRFHSPRMINIAFCTVYVSVDLEMKHSANLYSPAKW